MAAGVYAIRGSSHQTASAGMLWRWDHRQRSRGRGDRSSWPSRFGAVGHLFAQLHAELVEGVYAPDEAFVDGAGFVKGQQTAHIFGGEIFQDDGGRGVVAGKGARRAGSAWVWPTARARAWASGLAHNSWWLLTPFERAVYWAYRGVRAPMKLMAKERPW